MCIITLLTDFGTSDGYVGAMKGVILSINPKATIIDISHDIPRQDILSAAIAIENYARYYPVGTIHLAIVDPGVGSNRLPIVTRGRKGIYVTPDNGLISFINRFDEILEVYSIQNKQVIRTELSNTFHGRDIFAPAAAHLSLNFPIESLGSLILNPVILSWPALCISSNMLIGEVVHIDIYGNCITNIPTTSLSNFSSLQIADTSISHLSSSYAHVSPAEPLAIIGSRNLLEISINQGNASESLKISRGDKVKILLNS